jgi:hypothetical protein
MVEGTGADSVSSTRQGRREALLETVLKLYVTSQAGDVRSPVPHLFGPPGCGKSTVVQQAADMLGVTLHIINVSRISPLELEGVQMPVDENTRLHLLTATFWTQLKEGDILLLDEFLRGFPEVYSGMLDILTSRQVGGFKLPKVFIIAASNSTVTYDPALEDRLMHIKVPDLRKLKSARKHTAQLIIDQIGLMPAMVDRMEMQSLIDTEILPMYELLDQIGGKVTAGSTAKGCSVRNLIGQARLRHITSTPLRELLDMNNRQAITEGKYQYVVLSDGKHVDPKYVRNARGLVGNSRLTEIQAINLDLNLQLISMEEAKAEKEGDTDYDDDDILTT